MNAYQKLVLTRSYAVVSIDIFPRLTKLSIHQRVDIRFVIEGKTLICLSAAHRMLLKKYVLKLAHDIP